MDAYVQLKVWEALAQELEKDPQSKAIYEEEMIPLWPIILESQEAGLKLDQDRVREALEWHQAQQEAVVKEAQALCGYPILLSSPEQVSTWLYEVEKLGVKRRGKRGA
jgi:DNA polymerase I-like protein with 3'-5' exonuclease and polymerase domains